MSSTDVKQPYVTKPAAPLDAISAAVGMVRRDWGDYGYRVSIEGSSLGLYLFGVRCSDGSEFHLLSDGYGNCHQVEWNGTAWTTGTHA